MFAHRTNQPIILIARQIIQLPRPTCQPDSRDGERERERGRGPTLLDSREVDGIWKEKERERERSDLFASRRRKKEERHLIFFIRRMERRMSNLVLCSRERENGRKDELNGVGLGGGKGRERVRGKGKGKRSTCSHGF